MWGSTIGLLIGPFVIPVAGILIGPFLGAVIAELLVERRPFGEAVKSGVGSLVGFFNFDSSKSGYPNCYDYCVLYRYLIFSYYVFSYMKKKGRIVNVLVFSQKAEIFNLKYFSLNGLTNFDNL